jgi:hypothetical protein
MTSRALPVLMAVLLTAPATGAFAAPVPSPPPSPADQGDAQGDEGEQEKLVWYGYKLLLADAASLTLVFAGIGSDLAPLGVTGLGGVFLGGPIVHGIEGQGGRALASLGLRVGMPLAGAALATWSYNRGNDKSGECDCMGGFLATAGGLVLGMGAAMLVDAAFLGWRSEPIASDNKSLSLVPSFGLAPGGGSVGLAGRF